MRIWIIGLLLLVSIAAEAAEYRAIYQVSATREGLNEEFAAILPFYEDAIKRERALDDNQKTSNRQFFVLDRFDINSDGNKEIIAIFYNHETCGINQCAIDFFELKNGRIRNLAGIYGHENFWILSSRSHGLNDIAFYGANEKGEGYAIWKHDGNEYKFFKRIGMNEIELPKAKYSRDSYPLHLSSEGNEKARQAVMPFYEQEVKEAQALQRPGNSLPDGQNFLFIDTHDMNNDGVEEIFVHFRSDYSCGVAGCPFSIYQSNKDSWKEICSTMLGSNMTPYVGRRTDAPYRVITFIRDEQMAGINEKFPLLDDEPMRILHWDKEGCSLN